MSLLADNAVTLLGTIVGVDLHTAASTTIYTTPPGKVTRVLAVLVRDTSASCAGGTNYSVTGLGGTFTLTNLTTLGTGYAMATQGTATQGIEVAASTAVQLTVTTGTTANPCTGTVDVFGTTV
jgi:hypothetical protein